MLPPVPFNPKRLRDEQRHQAVLWGEQHGDEPCSQEQAMFVASLWGSAFNGTSKEKSQAYHSCLEWIWRTDSAKGLSKAEAHTTIEWLFSGEYTQNEKGKDVPVLNEQAVQETQLVLREALKEKGQMELL